MKCVRSGLAGLALLVVSTGVASASHDPRHGDACTAPEEDTFMCGQVEVTLPSVYEIDDVLAGCDPAGEVIEVVGSATYFIAVPVGQEIELRDCYASQPYVTGADLIYLGFPAPNTAMSGGSRDEATTFGFVLAMVGIYLGLRGASRSRTG